MSEKLNSKENSKCGVALENDHRFISDNLLNELIDGVFSEFIKFAREHKNELAVCFRGNSEQECIDIYYNNHMFWQLYLVYGKYGKVKINYNHARYYNGKGGYKAPMNKLAKLGFETKDVKKSSDGKVEVGYLHCEDKELTNGKFSAEFVEESYRILKEIMASFFSLKDQEDQFRKYIKVDYNRKKVDYIEKRWQQRLFRYYKNVDNGLFVYDMEFSQKTIDDTEDVKASKLNEPDMLAIRFEGGKPKALILIEVKCTHDTCLGDTGIEKHLIGMQTYSQNERLMINRKKDAVKILEQYKKIGLYEELDEIKNEYLNESYFLDKNKVKVERLLILTDNELPERENHDSAVDYYWNRNRKIDIDGMAQENACEVRLIQGHYFDENISDVIVFQPTGD